MMAGKRCRQSQAFSHVARRSLVVHTRNDDRQPCWIRQQTKGLCQLGCLIKVKLTRFHMQTVKRLFNCCLYIESRLRDFDGFSRRNYKGRHLLAASQAKDSKNRLARKRAPSVMQSPTALPALLSVLGVSKRPQCRNANQSIALVSKRPCAERGVPRSAQDQSLPLVHSGTIIPGSELTVMV